MNKRWLISVLMVPFIETLGHGLVFSFFPTIFLQSGSPFFSDTVSLSIRGVWLGIAIGAAPIARFLASSWVGAFSDRMGRKQALSICMLLGLLGYFGTAYSVWWSSLTGFIISRAAIGFLSCGWVVVSASVYETLQGSQRSSALSWLTGASSLGLVIGFSGGGLLGCLSTYVVPFFVASIATTFFVTLLLYLFPSCERRSTRGQEERGPIVKDGVLLFASNFLFRLGWASYWDLIAVWWMSRFSMGPAEISILYAYGCIWGMIANFLLLPYLFKKFSPNALLSCALQIIFISIFWLFFIENSFFLFIIIPMQQVALSVVFPAVAMLFARLGREGEEGKMMGAHQSSESLGMSASPLLSGMTVGVHAVAPVLFGGIAIVGAYIVLRTVRAISFSV